MIGPTGVGKTEIARRLARLAEAPFIKVEASKYTEVGYVGRDVESMIRDLVELAVNMVRGEKTRRWSERARELAEERLLDLLLPPTRPRLRRRPRRPGPSHDTREKLRARLRDGALDDRTVEIEVAQRGLPMIDLMGGHGMEEMQDNLKEMLGNLLPQRTRRRKVKIREARRILTQEEADKLVDMEEVTGEAIARVENSGIVFLDEIDKIAGREGAHGPDVSREGVQRDLLPIVEGCTVSTKYGLVRTDHILFIAAGAFHVSKPSDLIPELQGRFPIRVELASLTEQDFVRILTEPENALTKQYTALLATEGVDLAFTPDAVEEIAEIATTVNQAHREHRGPPPLHHHGAAARRDVVRGPAHGGGARRDHRAAGPPAIGEHHHESGPEPVHPVGRGRPRRQIGLTGRGVLTLLPGTWCAMDTVLVVDDDQLFLALVREELQKSGFEVVVAETAPQAKEALAARPVQAIIMDVVMPDTDGLELLPQFRTAYPGIPVIVVSGRASFLTGVQAMRQGAMDFLRKPLNFEELVQSVTSAIRHSREGGAQPSRLAQLARLQGSALELANMIRWDTLGEFLKDSAALFQRVIDLVVSVLDVEIVSLMLVREPEGMLRIVHAKGLDPEVQQQAACPIGEGIAGWVAQTGEPLLIRDLAQDPTFGKRERNPRYHTNSLMVVPLKVNGRTVGVMNANNKITGEPFDEHDLALFTTFSCIVSLSLATAQLFEQLTASVDELAVTNARLARTNVELEARVRELQTLRGKGPQG